jgi:hypothetical protein
VGSTPRTIKYDTKNIESPIPEHEAQDTNKNEALKKNPTGDMDVCL